LKSTLHPIKLTKLFDLVLVIQKKRNISTKQAQKILGLKSRARATRYIDTAKWLLSKLGTFKGSFDDFIEKIKDVLEQEFKISKILAEMSSRHINANPLALKNVARDLGINIDIKTARALFTLSRELGLLSIAQISVFTPTIEDVVLNFIRNRGTVLFLTIEKTFPNAREIVLKLWLRGFIDIEGIEEIGLKPSQITDPDRIPADIVPSDSRFLSFWVDDISGERYASIVIPQRSRVIAKW